MKAPPAVPQFDEVFVYLSEPDLQNQQKRIRGVSWDIQVFWEYLVDSAAKKLPGLRRESKDTGVFWYPLPKTPIRAELTPTNSLYPFLGRARPRQQTGRTLHCLWLGMDFCPAGEFRLGPFENEFSVYLFIREKRPVDVALDLWKERRSSLEKMLTDVSARVSFSRDVLGEPAALDGYHPDPISRRHGLSFVRTVTSMLSAAECLQTFLVFARLYHAVQGVLRRDPARLDVLFEPASLDHQTERAKSFTAR